MAALRADEDKLRADGFDAEVLLTDEGATAAGTVAAKLRERRFDCMVIGAGVRVVPRNLALFETVVNVVHEHAHKTRIAFNTGPHTSSDAAKRWL